MIKTTLRTSDGFKVGIGLTATELAGLKQNKAITFTLGECGVPAPYSDRKVAVIFNGRAWRQASRSQASMGAMAQGYRFLFVLDADQISRIATGGFGFRILPEQSTTLKFEFLFFSSVFDDIGEAERAFRAAGLIDSGAEVRRAGFEVPDDQS